MALAEGKAAPKKGSGQRRYRGHDAAERRLERRERLEAAGLELFGTVGFAATSVKAVCEAAGVSPRHFYEHFRDREALLAALVQRLGEELTEASFSAAADDPELDSAVRAGVRAYLAILAGDRRKARLLFRESVGVSEAVESVRGEIRDRFADFVRARALALGTVKAETPRNILLPVGVVGAVQEMASRAFLEPGDLDLDALTDQCCLVYLAVAERL